MPSPSISGDVPLTQNPARVGPTLPFVCAELVLNLDVPVAPSMRSRQGEVVRDRDTDGVVAVATVVRADLVGPHDAFARCFRDKGDRSEVWVKLDSGEDVLVHGIWLMVLPDGFERVASQ